MNDESIRIQTKNMGKVAPMPRGTYDPTAKYRALDIVLKDYSSYLAVKDVPVGTDVTNTEYWHSLSNVAMMGNDLQDLAARVDALSILVDSKIDGGYADDEGYLILTANGEPATDKIGPFAGGGGGGGGSGNNAVLTITNETGWITNTIGPESACNIKFTWSSVEISGETEIPTGNGICRITVGNVAKRTMDVAQGQITLDVSPYLAIGSNSVVVSVEDIYGNRKTMRFVVTVVELKLESTFDASLQRKGSFAYTYTPTGAVAKTMHFLVDDVEIGTEIVLESGQSKNYVIPAQSHGVHKIKVYFTATIAETEVRSNELEYEVICFEEGNTTPIIKSDYAETTVKQYSTINVKYQVFTPPDRETSVVVISVNDVDRDPLTVNQSEQTFSYRCNDVGALKIAIKSGVTTRTFNLTVEQSEIDIEAVTEGLALHMTAVGRSNAEAHPEVWESEVGDTSATLTGFNFVSDGWQTDDEGSTVLRVSGDARVNIPFKIFENNFLADGKTIEVEFGTRDVMSYDAEILSCFSGGRGFKITAQNMIFKSAEKEMKSQFKENEHLRVGFVVQKYAEQRLIECFINGIISGVVRYESTDNFAQLDPVGISIGSNDCTTDIYTIRVYNANLDMKQMLNNWIADTQNINTMIDRYNHNDIYDSNTGKVSLAKLPNDLSYMILECPQLPQFKGDKKTCSGSFVNPLDPTKNFTFEGAQIDVQGTSSQYYARKNYKIKFKKGFILSDGTTVSKYAMADGLMPINVMCFKADVASSEGANNVKLAHLYNEACPYQTPAQERDPRVRQGIEGYPCVIFHNNGTTTDFLGKYNENVDKSAENFFGFEDGDESWEAKLNGDPLVEFRSDDYSDPVVWQDAWEARFPDTDPAYTNVAQLQEFASWIVKTDTTKATGAALPSPVTYGTGDDAVTYNNDTAEYRLAKFRNEVGNYVELDSALFFYLFTELFLMIDNRAKNMFPSFIGTPING